LKINPKKKLGQNFLVDKNILNKIIDSSKITNSDYILEIGPGTGNLTDMLLKKKPKKMVVVEKDKNLIPLLSDRFNNKIEILNSDILNINEKKIFNKKCKVFGNLPYNISTKILTKWIMNLDNSAWFYEMYLMFQKEVADRIISKDNNKNYGRLSILSQWRLDCEKMFNIKPTSFFPVPKVESTLIKFSPKKNYIKIKNTKKLEYVTKVFFNQRRKKIKRAVKFLFNNNYSFLEKSKINLNLRPQNLPPKFYFNIAKLLEDN